MPNDKKQQKELIYAELENLKSTNMARPIMFEDSVVYAEIKNQKVTDQQEEVKTSSVRELIKKFDTASTSQHFSSLSKKINFTNEIKSNQKEQQTYNKSVDKDRKELRQFKEKSNENHLVAKDIQLDDKNELFANEQTYKEIIKNIDDRSLNIKSVSDYTLTLSGSQEKRRKRFTNWMKKSRLGKILGFNNYYGKDKKELRQSDYTLMLSGSQEKKGKTLHQLDENSGLGRILGFNIYYDENKKELRQLDESSNKNRLIANKVEIDDKNKKLFRINEQTYKKIIKNINNRPLKKMMDTAKQSSFKNQQTPKQKQQDLQRSLWSIYR